MKLNERKAWLSMIKDLGIPVQEEWKTIDGLKTCEIRIGAPVKYLVTVAKGNTRMPKKVN